MPPSCRDTDGVVRGIGRTEGHYSRSGRRSCSALSTRFIGESAERVLRRRELSRPVLLVAKLVEQPLRNPVLFLGRKPRELRDGRVQRAGHAWSLPFAAMPRFGDTPNGPRKCLIWCAWEGSNPRPSD